jgi:hypothetical protein
MKRICLDPAARALLLAAVPLVGLHAFIAYSQQDTGAILGTVTDPRGAVVGATVKIINIATSLATDQNGDFIATPLRIGVYRVEAEAPGFKKPCTTASPYASKTAFASTSASKSAP